MLTALLCGANPAAMPEPNDAVAAAPPPPPLTGDYRVRPRMSTKRTNTAGSFKTLMGKKSRDSFFCSDAQQLELASDAASTSKGEGGKRWWRSDKENNKEGSVKSSHTKNASSSSSATSLYSSSASSTSPSVYSTFSPLSSPSSPPSPFAPLSRVPNTPGLHPYADTAVSSAAQSYFDLPSRPSSARSKSSGPSHVQGNNALGLRLDLSSLSAHELRMQPPRTPPAGGLPQVPSSSYDPSKRSSLESASAGVSPPKSLSPLPPSWELAHPMQTEGSGATWRPELAARKDSDPLQGVDRTSKAVRSLTQTLLAKLNFSTVYLCRVPASTTSLSPAEEDDMTSLIVYQAGCGALPSRRSSSLLHARALSSTSGAIIYRRPQPQPADTATGTTSSASSVHTQTSATQAGPAAHASGVLVEVLAGAGQNGERLVLAGFVSDVGRRLGGEEVAVCKRVAAEIGRLLRKEERKANMI